MTNENAHVDSRYPLSALTGRIIAAAQEVHRVLGPGFEEVIYQRALAKELPAHSLDNAREVWIDVLYKGEKVGQKRVDSLSQISQAACGSLKIPVIHSQHDTVPTFWIDDSRNSIFHTPVHGSLLEFDFGTEIIHNLTRL